MNNISWDHTGNFIDAIMNPLITETATDNLVGQVILPLGAIIIFGMIVWGGFKYIQNDPEAGKKTLTAAVIGAIIIALATVIVNQVTDVIHGNINDTPTSESDEIDPEGESE